MPRSILIRRAPNGGWCGTMTPMPKMPAKDSVLEWKDFASMVQALKSMRISVTTGSAEIANQLEAQGIVTTRNAKPARKP